MMRCQEIQEVLQDYIDNLLKRTKAEEIEIHLNGCKACRKEERLLRSIIDDARELPRTVEPPRDLWPSIANRIEGRQPFQRISGRDTSPHSRQRSWWLAAAAVLVVSLAVTGSFILFRSGEATHDLVSVRKAADVIQAKFMAADLERAEAEYLKASGNLARLLNERKAGLSPETAEIVNKNMIIIDNAISELKTAMEKEPGNAQIPALLLAMYQKELDLLQEATQLSASM
ncbi:anti-sigma factor family protein [Acidobacteriota bacterium]